MTITHRLAVAGVFLFILAICFALSARKKSVVITEARAETDHRVIGDYPLQAQWPNDSLSREFEQEPRGM